ncbi:MAG: molybdopterin converting factor subunit 1, partial [Rhizomicrobium sp.]|nr:molybdopterin converting factor subunit 1 [Rhizomicrobium sp.]
MKLLYFAWVRQKLGKGEEERQIPEGVATVAALATYLAALGPDYAEVFSDPARLRAAVNQTHARFDAPVRDADEVAFFPPVTG